MARSIIKLYILISFSIFLASCNAEKHEDIDYTDVIGQADSKKNISAESVFNSIPNSEVITKLCEDSKAEYNSGLLNDPYNINIYTIESSKALNLGVYGSDLNVTSVFEQSQESMLFLKCVNALAKSIGVSSAFDEKMIDRMEKNKTNKDSTVHIISQAFKNADIYLKKNGRPGTSSLLIAGAWIEALYISCSIANETKNQAIVKEIFNQKQSLISLIELLKQSHISDDATYILTDLIDLQSVIISKVDDDFNSESLKVLSTKLTDLRTKVVSPK